jgi:hypothetical protein
VLVVIVALAACGGGHASLDSAIGTLVTAQHPNCGTDGRVVAHYLATGDTGGQPEVDQSYATRRAEILREPEDGRVSLIRAEADGYITRCDEHETSAQVETERQAQQQRDQQQYAEQQRQREQQQAQAEADRNTLYASTCQSHGGTVKSDSYCAVSYRGRFDQPVPVKYDGTWDQAQAESNRRDCESAARDAASSGRDGHPWSKPPVYHDDSGVCASGNP